ncbi:unnamed protein product [Pieris brassicae]|uniref:Uncharacterized protein n=1 Tax=Pieris brassicae TaxID=7116 RepID=A0A9P0U3L1_PIEBR|nr:unnamed protein product [Pieris brassicae]
MHRTPPLGAARCASYGSLLIIYQTAPAHPTRSLLDTLVGVLPQLGLRPPRFTGETRLQHNRITQLLYHIDAKYNPYQIQN